MTVVIRKIDKPAGKKPPRGAKREAWQAIHDAADGMTPRVRRAFIRAVEGLKSEIKIRELARLLETGDVHGVIQALGLERLEGIGERLGRAGAQRGEETLRAALVETFRRGAEAARETLPKSIAIRARFDLINPRAVEFINRYSFELIRQVSTTTRLGVQAIIRDGFLQGKPPLQMSREIRQIVGLDEGFAKAVNNFRRGLEERDLSRAMVNIAGKHRRLDAATLGRVRRAIKDGTLTQTQINEFTEKYSFSLLNRRAQNIARTETIRASSEGQQEMWRQAVEQDLLDPGETRRIWIVTPDDRLRDTHRAVPGMNPDGVRLDQPFRTPIGSVMNPPMEVNCRCAVALTFIGDDELPEAG